MWNHAAHLICPGREELEGEKFPASLDGLVHFVDNLHDCRSPWQELLRLSPDQASEESTPVWDFTTLTTD